jgi:hypothetical protein
MCPGPSVPILGAVTAICSQFWAAGEWSFRFPYAGNRGDGLTVAFIQTLSGTSQGTALRFTLRPFCAAWVSDSLSLCPASITYYISRSPRNTSRAMTSREVYRYVDKRGDNIIFKFDRKVSLSRRSLDPLTPCSRTHQRPYRRTPLSLPRLDAPDHNDYAMELYASRPCKCSGAVAGRQEAHDGPASLARRSQGKAGGSAVRGL